MLAEHEELRNTNTEIQRGIAVYLRDSDHLEAKGMIERYGAHFIGLLRDHIDKENNILFVMADMHLDKTQIDKVIELFHRIEGKGGING
jgi:hemerythrin-like domain-containing protein